MQAANTAPRFCILQEVLMVGGPAHTSRGCVMLRQAPRGSAACTMSGKRNDLWIPRERSSNVHWALCPCTTWISDIKCSLLWSSVFSPYTASMSAQNVVCFPLFSSSRLLKQQRRVLILWRNHHKRKLNYEYRIHHRCQAIPVRTCARMETS